MWYWYGDIDICNCPLATCPAPGLILIGVALFTRVAHMHLIVIATPKESQESK